MKGATITTTNNSTFGNISSIGNAGKYEFSTICGFLNNTVVLSNHLLNSYDVSLIQVIRVPVYTNAEVTGALTAQAWDAATGIGGVLAFEVTGILTLNANVSADGAGFKGGTLIRFTNCFDFLGVATAYSYDLPEVQGNYTQGGYKGEAVNVVADGFEGGKGKQANGGGGGNNHNTGGGGGANYGTGGLGGSQSLQSCNGANYGIGGAAINSYGYTAGTNKIFPGGGGGSGHANNTEGTPGGDGGGIIYIKAATVIGNGYSITAKGTQGINNDLAPNPLNEARGDGGGGGGAGGVVLLSVTTFSGNVTVEANGADGSTVGFQNTCMGPGGGGGGGVIWSASTLPANVNTNVNGGISGFVRYLDAYNAPCEGSTNGATAGSIGVVQAEFAAPQGTNTINCDILPLDLLKQFAGKRIDQQIQLNWVLANAGQVKKIVVEKKTGNAAFQPITEILSPATVNGFFVDEQIYTAATYRLLVYALNGNRQYSHSLFFDTGELLSFNLYPNPVNDHVTIQLPANSKGKSVVTITDVNGKQLLQQTVFMQQMQFTLRLSVSRLPAGIYHLRLQNNERQYSSKFIKQ